MHTLQSHFEFMLINLKGLWAITFHFPRLLVFPFSSKSICLSLLLQTSHTSSPCHSLLMTYFLGQGAKRALGREPVPPPVLPHPTCPPPPPRCHGPHLRPAAGLLPSFTKDHIHPLKQDPSSSLLCHWFSFLFWIVPILRTGPWNPGCIPLLPLSSATFYSCLLCGQQKSCPSVPSLVFLPSLVWNS